MPPLSHAPPPGGSSSGASRDSSQASAAPAAAPAPDDDDKAQRHAALARQMGAMFLQHRVAELEADVHHLARAPPPSRRPAASRGGAGGGMMRGGAARPRMQAPAPGHGQQRRTLHTAARAQPPPTPELPQPPLILLDASVLVYSLRSVHEWLKRAEEVQCRLVVPTEVITTLDVLKKGTHALNVAARNATRFLEERIGGPDALHGLVPQALAATAGPLMSLDEADAMRMACSSSTLDGSAPPSKDGWATDGGEQDFSLRRANAAHRAVLLLALSLPDHVLAVADPPPSLGSKAALAHSDYIGAVASEERPRWCERVDGARAARLAEAHGVQTLRCPTARSWLELDASSPATSIASLPSARPHAAQAMQRRSPDDTAVERTGRCAAPGSADRSQAATPEPSEAQPGRPRIIFAE